jgi:hypothetical protein
VSWWQVLLLCWAFYMLGFITAALMAASRDDPADNYKAGLNDD